MFIFTQKKYDSCRLSEVHVTSFIIITRCWSDKLKTISLWYYIKSKFATGRLYINIYRQGKDKEFSYTNCSFPTVRYRFHVCQNTWFFFYSQNQSTNRPILYLQRSAIKRPTRVLRKLYRLATIQRRLVFRTIQCIIRLVVSCFGEIKQQQRVRNNIILLECVLRFFRVVIQRTVEKTIISILL